MTGPLSAAFAVAKLAATRLLGLEAENASFPQTAAMEARQQKYALAMQLLIGQEQILPEDMESAPPELDIPADRLVPWQLLCMGVVLASSFGQLLQLATGCAAGALAALRLQPPCTQLLLWCASMLAGCACAVGHGWRSRQAA